MTFGNISSPFRGSYLPAERKTPAERQCIKVKFLRQKNYASLDLWIDDPSNLYVGRHGRIFITENKEERIFNYPNSKWCNPYTLKENSLEEALTKYLIYILESPLLYELPELLGLNLGCFCETCDCHAQILLDLLNCVYGGKKKLKVVPRLIKNINKEKKDDILSNLLKRKYQEMTTSHKEASPREAYYFFYQTASPFSNFHSAAYTLHGETFHSSEQGFMYGKAILFDDMNTASKILQAKTPAVAKKLGREVKHFNVSTWNKNKISIMRENVLAKFSQNEKLKMKLLELGNNKKFVEASPNDKIWGIGLREDVAKDIDENKWPGENLLGKVLDSVREELE